MQKVCVVIPVHSSTPTANELISFKQCYNVLNGRPIKIIAPKGLNLSVYKNCIKNATNLDVIYINSKWQSSLVGYNRLKMSRFFYKIFSNYNFLLTYELDCFIFKDELDYWCDKSYDYIGAPWFEGYSVAIPGASIIGVGNSGFSLRNVQTILRALRAVTYREPLPAKNTWSRWITNSLRAAYRWGRNQLGENNALHWLGNVNEDVFFGKIITSYFPDFRLAPVADAIEFSFEVLPRTLFVYNNNNLPTGCHAWWRYDLEFWRPHIEKFGHNPVKQ